MDTAAAISAYAQRLAEEHGPLSEQTLDAAADILAVAYSEEADVAAAS